MADARPEIIEATLLRVPLEALKRAAKDRKAAVEEAIEALSALGNGSGAGDAGGASAAGAQQQQQLAALDALAARLESVKRKLSDAGAAEAAEADRCRARLEHLIELGGAAAAASAAAAAAAAAAASGNGTKSGAAAAAGIANGSGISAVTRNRARLDRVLVDHLLRADCHEAAARLAAAARIEPLCDAAVFAAARAPAAALRARDAGPALKWCADNRARLKKAKSPLEFKLRLQEFIELVRDERRLDAVAYARRHLAPWAPQHLPELQRALGALAFDPAARQRCARYAPLFDAPARWAALRELFAREVCRLASLPAESMLAVLLQAGLTALNNPAARREGGSKEDPLHLPAFRKLAEGLPLAKHVHSTLLCAVTREVMGDANPPMALPNGHVYSRAAVERLAAAHGGARVTCPVTGDTFAVGELRRLYIV